MDQYVTTYRKDYLWPYVRTYPLREGPIYATVLPPAPQGPSKSVPCTCGAGVGPGGEIQREIVAPINADSYEWSRLGPMGPLLDPKLYPAKVGSSPETPGMRIDQPNTYLKKLQEKYPYLYNVLQCAPPDDMMRRINVDRLRTTYQIDFCHLGKLLEDDEHPSGDYNNLIKESGVDGLMPLPCPPPPSPPSQLPGVDIRPKLKSIKRIEGNCTSRRSAKEEEPNSIRTFIPNWKSEYADGISKTGNTIIKDRLHQHGAISWGMNFSLNNSCGI